MNYLEHTTTVITETGVEHKLVRLQKYNESTHKATNKYYTDGKLVSKHERFICESKIDMTNVRDQKTTEKSWTK